MTAMKKREDLSAATDDKQEEHHDKDLKHRARLEARLDALEGIALSLKARFIFKFGETSVANTGYMLLLKFN